MGICAPRFVDLSSAEQLTADSWLRERFSISVRAEFD
jgi:hypothetical protein